MTISRSDGIGEAERKLRISAVEADMTSSRSMNVISIRHRKKLRTAAASLVSTRGIRLIFPDVTALI